MINLKQQISNFVSNLNQCLIQMKENVEKTGNIATNSARHSHSSSVGLDLAKNGIEDLTRQTENLFSICLEKNNNEITDGKFSATTNTHLSAKLEKFKEIASRLLETMRSNHGQILDMLVALEQSSKNENNSGNGTRIKEPNDEVDDSLTQNEIDVLLGSSNESEPTQNDQNNSENEMNRSNGEMEKSTLATVNEIIEKAQILYQKKMYAEVVSLLVDYVGFFEDRESDRESYWENLKQIGQTENEFWLWLVESLFNSLNDNDQNDDELVRLENYAKRAFDLAYDYYKPTFALYWGLALKRQGQLENAEKNFKKGLEYLNVSVQNTLIYNLACVYALSNQKEEALSHLARAIRDDEIFKSEAKNDIDFESLKNDEDFSFLVSDDYIRMQHKTTMYGSWNEHEFLTFLAKTIAAIFETEKIEISVISKESNSDEYGGSEVISIYGTPNHGLKIRKTFYEGEEDYRFIFIDSAGLPHFQHIYLSADREDQFRSINCIANGKRDLLKKLYLELEQYGKKILTGEAINKNPVLHELLKWLHHFGSGYDARDHEQYQAEGERMQAQALSQTLELMNNHPWLTVMYPDLYLEARKGQPVSWSKFSDQIEQELWGT